MRVLIDFTGPMSTNTGGTTYSSSLLSLWAREGEDDLIALFSQGQVPPALKGLDCVRELATGRLGPGHRRPAQVAASVALRRARILGGTGDRATAAYLPEDDTHTSSVGRVLDLHVRVPLYARSNPVDVAYFPGNSVSVVPATRTPMVAAIRATIAFHYPNQFRVARRLYVQAAIRHAVRVTDRLIVPSSAIADDLMRFAHAKRAKLVVVPHGVDLDFYSSRDPTAVDPALFAFVSKPWDYKGLGTLFRSVRALASAPGGAPPPRLAVADGGITTAQTRQLQALAASLGIGGRVEFLGRVDAEGLRSLYSRASALVVPTSCESFGHMFLEAAASGCPVITSQGHGIDETIGAVALQVPAHDHRAIMEAMSTVQSLGAEERAQQARALRTWAERFSWSKTLEETRQVLAEVAR